MALARLSALDRRLPVGTGTLVGTAALCVLLSGAAASVVKDGDGSVTAAPRPSVSAAATAVPAPTAASVPPRSEKPGQPADLLLDVATVLPGFTRLNDRIAGAGPMTLEDAAVIEAGGEKPTEEDRDALRELGYVRGHSRVWGDGESTTVVVIVYEWKDAEGPLMFVRGVEHVTSEDDTDWKPPIRRATGVCTVDAGEVDDSLLAAVGKHSFLVIVTRRGACSDHGTVTRVTEQIVRHAATLGA